MVRFKLLIEYDGSRYRGWQQNTGVKTVQGTIIQAIEELFHTKKIELYGSGRTDAGVHALGQVAHLDVTTQMHAESIAGRLNELLPYDIHILNAEKVSEKFHARHNATARSYVYMIARRRSAFGKPYCWWVKEELDIEKMKSAARILKGFHDFSSFGAATVEEKSTKVNIEHLEVNETGNIIMIHIIGSHFLWMMVRRITGVLVHAGKGKLSPDEIKQFINRHSERPSQLSAPPSGLYLERVYYATESYNLQPGIPITVL